MRLKHESLCGEFFSFKKIEDFFQKIIEFATKNSKMLKEKKSLHDTCLAHGLSWIQVCPQFLMKVFEPLFIKTIIFLILFQKK